MPMICRGCANLALTYKINISDLAILRIKKNSRDTLEKIDSKLKYSLPIMPRCLVLKLK